MSARIARALPPEQDTRPATDKQFAFLCTLVDERGAAGKRLVDERLAARGLSHPRQLVVPQMSDLIGEVKAMPHAARSGQADAVAPVRRPDAVAPEVGRYAVEYLGVLRFYSVVQGKRGGIFLNRFRSDALGRVSATERAAVYAQIAQDGAEAARLRFALKTERCWTCGRRLTDPLSMSLGQGPDCRAGA